MTEPVSITYRGPGDYTLTLDDDGTEVVLLGINKISSRVLPFNHRFTFTIAPGQDVLAEASVRLFAKHVGGTRIRHHVNNSLTPNTYTVDINYTGEEA